MNVITVTVTQNISNNNPNYTVQHLKCMKVTVLTRNGVKGDSQCQVNFAYKN